jgi:hypothetical protein
MERAGARREERVGLAEQGTVDDQAGDCRELQCFRDLFIVFSTSLVDTGFGREFALFPTAH